MKNKILIAVSIVFTTSCLDVELDPIIGNTSDKVFNSLENYQQYLAKIYASLTLTGQSGPAGNPDLLSEIINDEGFSSYLRVWWKLQELTTDEAVIAWTDGGIQDLHNHSWSSSNQFVLVLYYRIFYTISLANDFIELASDPPNPLTPAEMDVLETYVHDARFLRAYAYYHALDAFRNIPLLTTISRELASQEEPSVIFNFIESELKDIESELPDPTRDVDFYGRPNKGAVWMLLSKLYLNAEVYVGESHYAEAIPELNKVIGSSTYSLAQNYSELFMGDNHNRTDEIIWSIVHDGVVSQTWGGTTTIIRGGIGGSMNAADYGVPSGWGGWRTTRAFVEKFPGAADNDGVSPDSRAIFYTNGQTLDIADVGEYTNGWSVPKFSNIEASSGIRAPGVEHVSTDFPVFRLADAYLMLAECELNTSTLTNGTLDLLNELRERAYGDASGNVTLGEVDLSWILDERARELGMEATRRTDLIRHGKFTGDDYLWPWKGGEEEGILTPEYLNIFPIPALELVANPNIKQNDEY